MFKRLQLLLTTSILALLSFAQFGNEWINYNQTYYKFELAEQGIYRLSYETLDSAGIPVSTIDPRNFQLFTKGKEQAIWIEGESDGSFDPGEYIEFYGEGNDGWLDSALYRSPEEHTNPYYSLYSDSLPYFLTWNSSKVNLRFKEGNEIAKSINSSDHFMHTMIYPFHSDFYGGIPVGNDNAKMYSEYVSGEGWHKGIWNSQQRFQLATPSILENGASTTINVRGYSNNHNVGIIENGYNHEFALSLKSKSNVLVSKKALGHEKIELSVSINSNLLSEVNDFFIGEITYLGGSGKNLTFITINYPRKFDLNNRSSIHLKTNLESNYVTFSNYDTTKYLPVVYNFSEGIKLKTILENDSLSFQVNNPTNVEIYVTDESDVINIQPHQIAESRIPMYDLEDFDYFIISNKKLERGAEDYKSYRASTQGGSYKVKVLYVQDIVNNFSYGIDHPIGIKNLCQTLPPSTEHILLLGKGQTHNRMRKDARLRKNFNLVQTIGLPPSDVLFVSDYQNNELLINRSIGRVPAKNLTEINNYLDKIKALESQDYDYKRKKVVQLAGGSTTSENNQFKAYLRSYGEIISDTSFGGYTKLFSKQDPLPVDNSLTGEIIEEVNSGVSLVSYFGHGAAQITEISLGDPSDYNNRGLNPLFIFNGCALGNTFEDLSLCEKFLFEKDNGAIGWIASTNFGFSNALFSHTKKIHNGLFNNRYGKGVGSAMQYASEHFGNPNSPMDILEARQLVYHGDPALNIYSPNKPDFTIEQVLISSNSINTDSITLDFNCRNNGKADHNEARVSFSLFNQTGSLIYRDSFNAPRLYSNTTYQINVPKENLTGLVNLSSIIDPDNSIDELIPTGELNNNYNTQFIFNVEKPQIILPYYNAIVPNNNPEVVIRINNKINLDQQVTLQWDTTPHFIMPLGQETFSTYKDIFRTSILLPILNNRDYYLRVRTTKNGKHSDWSLSTFGVLEGEAPGWTEGNSWKYFDSKKESLIYDTLNREFIFGNTNSNNYGVEAHGENYAGFPFSGWITYNGELTLINWWPSNGVNLMVLNPLDETRYIETDNEYNVEYPPPFWQPGQPNQYTIVGENSGIYNYNTNDTIAQDSLSAFLNRIPQGFHLIMVNARSCNVQEWGEELFEALEGFGILDARQVQEGEPFAFFAVKGSLTSTEHYGDAGSVLEENEQSLKQNYSFPVRSTSGKFHSSVVGAAKSWGSLELDFKNIDVEDNCNVEIQGSLDNNQWFALQSQTYTDKMDLSAISASNYPFLRFNLILSDSVKRTAPQLIRWKINYQPVGDLVIDQTSDHFFNSDTINNGEDLSFAYTVKNLGVGAVDSTKYVVKLKTSDNKIIKLLEGDVPALQRNESIILQDTIKILNYLGDNRLIISLNETKDELESSFENNITSDDFISLADKSNPLLDVSFDGIHIVDNQIVSPNPNITIQLSDENEFIFLLNESTIKASLLMPDGTIDSLKNLGEYLFVKGDIDNNNTASVNFTPTSPLADGEYTLSVIGQDGSGNPSSDLEYNVSFKVINQSSISNFYAYPNPIINSTRFVYTLTGSDLPDYLKVQVLTISGRVVRELVLSDFGGMHIGNNISELVWDGTDQFGDRLANGTYLYRVIAELNGKSLDLYNTGNSDQFFHNGYGKLYLMH